MKTKHVILIFIILICSSSYVHSQIGLTLGNEYGVGAIGQVGTHQVKLEAGAGFLPLLVYWQITGFGVSDETYLKFYFPFHFGANINIGLSKPEDKNRLGLKLGAHQDAIMKTGFGGGVDYVVSAEKNTIVISGGLLVYPKAYDELLERLRDEENKDFSKDDISATFINIRPFVSISIFFK